MNDRCFTLRADVNLTLFVHPDGTAISECDDAPLAIRLPNFAPADLNDLREVSVRFQIVRRELHEPATYSTPAWKSIDLELDRGSPTLLTCEGVVSFLLPDAAAGLFEELSDELCTVT